MKSMFEQFRQEALAALGAVTDVHVLEDLRSELLGRKGKMAGLMKQMAELADEERKLIGKVANEVKMAVEAAFEAHEKELAGSKGQEPAEALDTTQPPLPASGRGHVHPVTQVQQDLEDLFTSMGFLVADGPEMESDFYNFTALNIPPTHPARDMQDTFYVEKPEGPEGAKKETNGAKWVMRTQTSSVQVRAMRQYGVPLRAIVPGRCFRNEATDARHEHTFHQLEGMVIDRGITFADMKGVFQAVADHLYGPGTKIRLSPKFYPFVEPGVRGELECFLCKGEGCRVCKKSGWLETMPGGMIHPNVLRAGGIDPNIYSGFAFGFGLTRLVMLKYGIDDIRHLESGDLRFLNQF